MADYEDKVLHELDGIKEFDNPMPGGRTAAKTGMGLKGGG